MGEDEFTKQAGKAVQATVAATAALVGGAPGVALAVGTVATFNFFESLASRNDEALREFRIAALEGELVAVRDKLRELDSRLRAEGKHPDRQDALTQNAVASEFVSGVTQARTAEKKEAIVSATVAQFDPRRGSPAMRDYWLRRVRELPEHELSLVMLIASHGALAFLNKDVVVLEPDGNGGSHVRDLDLPPESKQALFTIAHQMTGRVEVGRLIVQSGDSRTIPRNGNNYAAHPFQLTPDGEIFLSFCKSE